MTKLEIPLADAAYKTYKDFWVKYYFKYQLPKEKICTHNGVDLDISDLPTLIKNRIINVGYEDDEVELCQQVLKPADSVLEVGGAIGFIGLYCQKILGIKEYVTVEANPASIKALKRNYELNNLCPRVFHYALADADGTVDLDVSGDFWGNSLMGGSSSAKKIQVRSLALPSLIQALGFKGNTLIMDIEGAESFINFVTLPDQFTKVIMELHPKIIGEAHTYKIISDLINKGFSVSGVRNNSFALVR